MQQPYEWGYQGMKLMAKHLEGDTSLVPDDGLIIVPTKVVDQSNVDAFEADLKAKIAERELTLGLARSRPPARPADGRPRGVA